MTRFDRTNIPPELDEYINELGSEPAGVKAEALGDLSEKFSDAYLERVVVGDHAYVLKHLPREGDWLTRATEGADRMSLLCSSGVFDQIDGSTDHAVCACIETRAGEHVVVMHDVSDRLVPPDVPVSRATSRGLLAGLARLHGTKVQHVDGLCSLGGRYRLFSPQFHASDNGTGQHPMREAIVTGWERFRELVPKDVAEAVSRIHQDPEALGSALARFPSVLLHGDAKPENMGLAGGKIVLIDWGDLTGFGPAEVDVAWYALKGAVRIPADPGEIMSDYEEVSGRKLDPLALDLACIGSLAQMGFRMANSATLGRPEPKELGGALLDWWTERVKAVLEDRPFDQLLEV